MWAVLGDIEFELLNHPTRQDERLSVDYAEHALIQGKPRLEFVGDGLDELDLELHFHIALVDPEEQVRRLKTALRAHEPLPFVLGSGDFRGVYLLTSVANSVRRTTEAGRLKAVTVNVTLREFTGEYRKPMAQPAGLTPGGMGNPLTRITPGVPSLPTSAQQALAYARQGATVLRGAVQTCQTLRELRDNPQGLLDQVPELLGQTGQSLRCMEGLQDVATSLEGAQDLVQLGTDVASLVRNAHGQLTPIDLGNVLGQVDYALDQVERANTRMDAAAPRLAGLAADIATRRV